MSLVNKIKDVLDITVVKKNQVEARKEAVKYNERILSILEQLAKSNQQNPPSQPASEREEILLAQISYLQSVIKKMQEERRQVSKTAADAFSASQDTQKVNSKERVGRPRKSGVKATLRIDARSWAAVEYLRKFVPHWKFTDFCNDAVSSRLEELFASDARLEGGFNIWMQNRLENENGEIHQGEFKPKKNSKKS